VEIKVYAFADRFLVPALQRAINNNIVDEIENGRFLEAYDIVPLAKEAFSIIPSDRPMLQLLVDYHCDRWRSCCEQSSPFPGLPYAFLARAMRRFSEMLQEKKQGHPVQDRCYYEHTDEAEAAKCGKLHMQYDKEKDFGTFGEEVICVESCGGRRKCRCSNALASSSSSSRSSSTSDSD